MPSLADRLKEHSACDEARRFGTDLKEYCARRERISRMNLALVDPFILAQDFPDTLAGNLSK